MTRETWLRTFGTDKEIWNLSRCRDLYEYLTRDRPGRDPMGRMPVFHVWHGDQWLYCGPSQAEADRVYREALEGIRSASVSYRPEYDPYESGDDG